MKEANALAKKNLEKKAKKIQAVAKMAKKIEERAKKNIKNAATKIQDLKCLVALSSTSKSFKEKKKFFYLLKKLI